MEQHVHKLKVVRGERDRIVGRRCDECGALFTFKGNVSQSTFADKNKNLRTNRSHEARRLGHVEE